MRRDLPWCELSVNVPRNDSGILSQKRMNLDVLRASTVS